MARILAIDYGEKRIGLAISDQEKKIAFEFETWPAKDFLKKLPGLVAEKEIDLLVLGYPLNLSGDATAKTAEVLAFKKRLEQLLPNISVELLDERFSSQMAQSIKSQLGGDSKTTRGNLDSLAAQIILQNFINKNQKNGEETIQENF